MSHNLCPSWIKSLLFFKKKKTSFICCHDVHLVTNYHVVIEKVTFNSASSKVHIKFLMHESLLIGTLLKSHCHKYFHFHFLFYIFFCFFKAIFFPSWIRIEHLQLKWIAVTSFSWNKFKKEVIVNVKMRWSYHLLWNFLL